MVRGLIHIQINMGNINIWYIKEQEAIIVQTKLEIHSYLEILHNTIFFTKHRNLI